MKNHLRKNGRALLVALLAVASPSLADAAGARCEVTLLRLPPTVRAGLEQRLKDAPPADAAKAVLAALAAPGVKIEAVAAVPAKNGFRVVAQGRLYLEVEVTFAPDEALISVTGKLECEGRKVDFENSDFRPGEVKLLPFPGPAEAEGAPEVAVMRVVAD